MSVNVTGTTKILGIFGDPVAHTLSPRMHNAAFRALGLNMMYLPFEVARHNLEGAIGGIRALNLLGVNLTHPHKTGALDLLDEVSNEVKEIGAVNTVVNREEILVGYNTDGTGFVKSLKDDYGFDPRGKRIVVMGAGGAGRAICWALNRENPERLTLVNRTFEKAEILARSVGACPLPWNDLQVESEICEAQLVVNTTSTPMDLNPLLVSEKQLIYDIVYNQKETPFITAVREKGARIGNGMSMLLHQGVLAFELWTGEKAPLEIMRRALFNVAKK
ncbi:MAG: shikimate dehydrogenase [Gemmatimonadota bacterium]|nr:MAG: shikimate dehydrogenase [Gemmatimonadota bacterium]